MIALWAAILVVALLVRPLESAVVVEVSWSIQSALGPRCSFPVVRSAMEHAQRVLGGPESAEITKVRWKERRGHILVTSGPSAHLNATIHLAATVNTDCELTIVPSDSEHSATVTLRALRNQSPPTKGAQRRVDETSMPLDSHYHSVAEMEERLRDLVSVYPALASTHVYGSSIERRSLTALRLCMYSEAAGRELHLPQYLIVGLHHAREWISGEVVMGMAEYIAHHALIQSRIRAIVSRAELWFVPVVNPDGYQYSLDVYAWWRKNRRSLEYGFFGVDLNRNYGVDFNGDGSSKTPNDDTYCGSAAYSEPETDALMHTLLPNVMDPLRVTGFLSYHNYGQEILYPFGYDANVSGPNEGFLRDLGLHMSQLMSSGNVGGASYWVEKATDLYPVSGDGVDAVYQAYSFVPSYTVEVRPTDTFSLDPPVIAAVVRENTAAALYFVEYCTASAAISRNFSSWKYSPSLADADVDADGALDYFECCPRAGNTTALPFQLNGTSLRDFVLSRSVVQNGDGAIGCGGTELHCLQPASAVGSASSSTLCLNSDLSSKVDLQIYLAQTSGVSASQVEIVSMDNQSGSCCFRFVQMGSCYTIDNAFATLFPVQRGSEVTFTINSTAAMTTAAPTAPREVRAVCTVEYPLVSASSLTKAIAEALNASQEEVVVRSAATANCTHIVTFNGTKSATLLSLLVALLNSSSGALKGVHVTTYREVWDNDVLAGAATTVPPTVGATDPHHGVSAFVIVIIIAVGVAVLVGGGILLYRSRRVVSPIPQKLPGGRSASTVHDDSFDGRV